MFKKSLKLLPTGMLEILEKDAKKGHKNLQNRDKRTYRETLLGVVKQTLDY